MEYRDFTLELLTDSSLTAQTTEEQELRIRWHFGNQSGAARTKLPPGLAAWSEHILDYLYEPPPEADVQNLAQQLSWLLWPHPVRQAFAAAESECQQSGHRLRVRVIAEDEPLVRLPFEFVERPWADRQGTPSPLLLDPFYSLVRTAAREFVSLEPVSDRPLRILVVGASPHAENLPWIDTEAESVLIRGALRPLAQQGRVVIQVLLHATREQLQSALHESRPQFDLVHLTCHTDFSEGSNVSFILEDERRLPAYVPVFEVGQWLKHAGVRVVVAPDCSAATLGLWLAKAGVPAAVMMQGRVSDARATVFVQNLYGFLADLLPLDAAMSLARRLQFEHMRLASDWGAPVLYLQSAYSLLFAPLKRLFYSPSDKPPERPEERLEWPVIVTLAVSSTIPERVRACQEFAAFYEHEVTSRPELSQQLSGRAAEAVEHLLRLAHSDSANEVRCAAQASLGVLLPSHLNELFVRLVEQLISADANARHSAEAILKAHGQFERALIATVHSRVHQGNTCFPGRENRIEVRLETSYPDEIRLQCEFGPRSGDGIEAMVTDRQEVVLGGPHRQSGSLLSFVTPREPKDFTFWVTLRTDGYSASPIPHPIRCQLLNPYNLGTGFDDSMMFYGREEELDKVVRNARSQNHMIIGERRIGKTSFLQAVARDIGSPLIPVMLGLPESEQALFRRIVLRAYTAARVRIPDLSLPLFLSTPEPTIYGFDEAEADMRQLIDRLKQDYESDAKFVLLIDEGDRLFFNFDEMTRIAIRHFIQEVRLSVMIACVRRPESPDDASSLINIFLVLRLCPLTVEQTRLLICKPLAGVLAFDDGAVEFIVRKTEGRPAFIQTLCHYAVEHAYRHDQKRISLAEMEAIYREHLLVPDFLPFKETWNRLSSEVQRQLLESLDKEQLPYQALQELKNLSIIEETDDAPRLPVAFVEWLQEGKGHSWLAPTS